MSRRIEVRVRCLGCGTIPTRFDDNREFTEIDPETGNLDVDLNNYKCECFNDEATSEDDEIAEGVDRDHIQDYALYLRGIVVEDIDLDTPTEKSTASTMRFGRIRLPDIAVLGLGLAIFILIVWLA